MFRINAKNDNSLDRNFRKDLIELIHAIRTPLASINVGSEILKEILPILINSYKKDNLLEFNEYSSLSHEKIDKLYSIIENNLTEAKRISEYIKKIEEHTFIQNNIEAING